MVYLQYILLFPMQGMACTNVRTSQRVVTQDECAINIYIYLVWALFHNCARTKLEQVSHCGISLLRSTVCYSISEICKLYW